MEERSDFDPEDAHDGLEFLAHRGLVEVVTEDDRGVFYGITDDGMRATYMLALFMSSSSDQGGDDVTRRVGHAAQEYVAALDGLAADSHPSETEPMNNTSPGGS